jgi:hypothetical protein
MYMPTKDPQSIQRIRAATHLNYGSSTLVSPPTRPSTHLKFSNARQDRDAVALPTPLPYAHIL